MRVSSAKNENYYYFFIIIVRRHFAKRTTTAANMWWRYLPRFKLGNRSDRYTNTDWRGRQVAKMKPIEFQLMKTCAIFYVMQGAIRCNCNDHRSHLHMINDGYVDRTFIPFGRIVPIFRNQSVLSLASCCSGNTDNPLMSSSTVWFYHFAVRHLLCGLWMLYGRSAKLNWI